MDNQQDAYDRSINIKASKSEWTIIWHCLQLNELELSMIRHFHNIQQIW